MGGIKVYRDKPKCSETNLFKCHSAHHILFLSNNYFSSADHRASGVRGLVRNLVDRMCKEADMAYFELLSRHVMMIEENSEPSQDSWC